MQKFSGGLFIMTKKIISMIILLLFASPVFAETASPQWITELKAAEDADQLVIISGTKGSNARFSFHQKDDEDNWHEILASSAYIGKKGWGKKIEGDNKTPTGVYTFNMAFGIADDPGCEMGYTKINDSHYWVGDPESDFYNQFVSIDEEDAFDTELSEHLIDYPVAYKYCLNINYNEDNVPGKGSAIFLHCQTKNKFTAGCVAIPENIMKELLTLVEDNCVVIMDTNKNITNY